jgi:acetolactate synthase-1/2/3 large subunit
VREADLLLVLGMRLGELNTIGEGFHGFSLLAAPRPAQRLVHIHADATELNRVYQADLPIHADPNEAAAALADLAPSPARPEAWRQAARAAWEQHAATGICPGPLDLKSVFQTLRARLPADSVVTVGAGAYALWAQRYFTWHAPRTQLGPKSGAMGYGLPAAIGAKLARPASPVVALAGDGCFLMHAEELATAIHHALPIVVIVLNNNCYGAIRLGQERQFGRSTGVALTNPDFVAYAHSFGAHAERVAETAEFAPALDLALAAGRLALIELVVPPEATRPPRA